MAGSHLHPSVEVFVVYVLLWSARIQRGLAFTYSRDVAALNGLSTTWTASPPLNWGPGDPCEDAWTGVFCDSSNTTVIKLDLRAKNLEGTISSSIGGLIGLTILELSNNPQLSGLLPFEIGQLSNLQILSIQYCSLTGPLPPQLGNLTSLTFLGLNNNTITGSLPASLGNTNLTWLDISTNQLSGSIPIADANNPVGLNNLSNIQHFHLNNNSLTGTIPAELFSVSSILHMLLNFNNLDGILPDVSNHAPNLSVIRVDGNKMQGAIPAGFQNFRSLADLNLNGNRFSGAVPNFANTTTLNFLDLSDNNFDPQPQFPSWVMSLTNLITLNLANMNISGSINPGIFDLPQIQGIDLSHNQLSGDLVFQNTTSPSLTKINLVGNQIVGFSGAPTTPNMNVSIFLEQNPICQNTYLSLPNPCGQESAGPLWKHPEVNSDCTDQSSERDNGQLLNWYTCSWSYPLELDILLTVPVFTNLNIGAKYLENDLSAAFGLFPNQTYVRYMNYSPSANVEALVWVFPNSGDSLPANLSNYIVSSLRYHRLNLQNLQNGYLLISGNTAAKTKMHKSFSTAAIIGIAFGSVFGVFIVGASIAYGVHNKIRAEKALKNNPFGSWGRRSSDFGEAPKLKGARCFTLEELKQYTDNWSDDFMIGVGGYGRVYRGVLPNGDCLAIKRASSIKGANEFKNEIELLSRVHHRNLVGLVGFCYEEEEQALIYEFMSNGTLTDHLHGRKDQLLSWKARLEIALASAIGINYLHDHASPPIIHRDIKSPNILLNEKLVAKVADFGLSKLAPDEGEKVVYTHNVKGTPGYLDPEYYLTQILTDKSDVYSFGVVLLELLTARPPIDHGMFVVREFREVLDEGGIDALRPLLDPAIKDILTADLEPFLKIALSCVEEERASRPTTAEIVKLLQALNVLSKTHLRVGAMDIEGGVKKVKFVDEFENDTEELLFGDFPNGRPATLYPSDSFRYSGAYGESTTLEPK